MCSLTQALIYKQTLCLIRWQPIDALTPQKYIYEWLICKVFVLTIVLLAITSLERFAWSAQITIHFKQHLLQLAQLTTQALLWSTITFWSLQNTMWFTDQMLQLFRALVLAQAVQITYSMFVQLLLPHQLLTVRMSSLVN